MPKAACEKIVLTNNAVQRMQRLRMKRFAMSMVTFIVVLLSTVLITSLGLETMNGIQWATFIGIGLLGGSFFFVLFYTNANLRFSEPSLTREQIVFWAFWGLFALYWMPRVRPIILLFYLPPFSFGILILKLRQYLSVVAYVMGLYASLLSLEYFQDPQRFNIQYQLFLFSLFGILLTWFAFFGGFVSNLRRRLRLQKEEIKFEIEERKLAQIEKDKLIVELKDALSKVKTLSGLLPICASCKKVRDDKGYWNQIESYIQDHSEAEFSHSICPECAKKLYPDIELYDETSDTEAQPASSPDGKNRRR